MALIPSGIASSVVCHVHSFPLAAETVPITIRSEEYVKAAIIAHTTRLDRYFRDILKIQIFESNYRTGS